MRLRALALAVLCAGLPVSGMAGPIAEIAARLQPPAEVDRGRFVQDKQLAEMEGRLRASGRFVLAAGQGLIWQVEAPFASTLVVTPESIRQLADGEELSRIDAGEQPAMRAVAAVLIAVLEGDGEVLDQQFEVLDAEIEEAGWRLGLRPRLGVVGELIQRVDISGSERVERLRIHEAGGDRSDIRLEHAADAEQAPLSEAEQALFAH